MILLDLVSNGFKFRKSATQYNASGEVISIWHLQKIH
jgi:hypothetical protein